jgi:adenylylsulfate kinase
MTDALAARGAVVWVTGLPSSGKSTLAARLRDALARAGTPSCVLDGDEVRAALVPRPGYSAAERDAFYETLAHLATLLASQGLVVVVPATANRAAYRDRARRAAPRFVEVHVAVGVEECRLRDAKGLYAATAAGKAAELPGAGVAYEVPAFPDVTADGGLDDAAVARVLALLSA